MAHQLKRLGVSFLAYLSGICWVMEAMKSVAIKTRNFYGPGGGTSHLPALKTSDHAGPRHPREMGMLGQGEEGIVPLKKQSGESGGAFLKLFFWG
jgi:hypothetical protein